MMHDFNVTRNHVIFMDLPAVFNLELAMSGDMPIRWDDDYPARLGVMPRDGTDEQVTWYDINPCYVFHPMNSWEGLQFHRSFTHSLLFLPTAAPILVLPLAPSLPRFVVRFLAMPCNAMSCHAMQ